ncbi:MAG: S41 family peptidase [Planctomycetota bacterium]|jgi:carboxyl-terminal processing protease
MRAGTALIIMLPLLAVVTAFVLVATRGAGAAPGADGVYWDEDMARFIRRRIANTYVDEIDDARAAHAFYEAMDGYVQDLDEYCDFIPPEEHRRWKEETRGEYAGLGVKVRDVPEGLLLVGIHPDGPAQRAGLRTGDTIVSAAGRSLEGMSLEQVETTNLLKGEPGSRVVLGVLRGPRPDEGPPAGPVELVEVRRAVIRPPTVFSRRVGTDAQFGVIRLTEFAEATEEDFNSALDAMIAADIKGVVLDLRDNGGGVLPTAVRVAGRFLDRGVVVRSEGRTRDATRVYTASPENTVPNTLPLVVLVNNGSASASEVVAGALQDHRRALLVGERTYGKFLIQQITEIPGSEAALKLTTSRYYLPSGRSYQRRHTNGRSNGRVPSVEEPSAPAGLLPDVVETLDEEAREALLMFWANEEAAPWGEEAPFPDVDADATDPQLQRALDLLEGQVVLRRIRRASPGGNRPH